MSLTLDHCASVHSTVILSCCCFKWVISFVLNRNWFTPEFCYFSDLIQEREREREGERERKKRKFRLDSGKFDARR